MEEKKKACHGDVLTCITAMRNRIPCMPTANDASSIAIEPIRNLRIIETDAIA